MHRDDVCSSLCANVTARLNSLILCITASESVQAEPVRLFSDARRSSIHCRCCRAFAKHSPRQAISPAHALRSLSLLRYLPDGGAARMHDACSSEWNSAALSVASWERGAGLRPLAWKRAEQNLAGLLQIQHSYNFPHFICYNY